MIQACCESEHNRRFIGFYLAVTFFARRVSSKQTIVSQQAVDMWITANIPVPHIPTALQRQPTLHRKRILYCFFWNFGGVNSSLTKDYARARIPLRNSAINVRCFSSNILVSKASTNFSKRPLLLLLIFRSTPFKVVS